MTEAKFQTAFSHWAKHNIKTTSVFELKVAKGDRLPLSSFKHHQIPNLLNAKKKKLFYKIPDSGYDQKPFDCFVISRAESYIVIMFYEKRGEKEFYMIDPDDWEDFKFNNPNKASITREEASKIAKRIERLA